MLKFKFFFDSHSGKPPEDEINDWLAEHSYMEIKNFEVDGDRIYIFYQEKEDL